MSAVAPTPPRRFYCHKCRNDFALAGSAAADDEPFCPNCNDFFVEEIEPEPGLDSMVEPDFFPLISSFSLRRPSEMAFILGGTGVGPTSSAVARGFEPFDPLTFLTGRINDLMAGGASIQIVVESSAPSGGFGGLFTSGPVGSIGDYLVGPGLEQLIQQLAENDPNRYGTPPAAKSVVGSLPDVKISQKLFDSDDAQCAVCMDKFDLDSAAKELPCKHIFHKDCIMPWLELHSSCPVCRFELPTDDPDYEQQRQAARQSQPAREDGSGNAAPNTTGGVSERGIGGGADMASPRTRAMERSVRLSVPRALADILRAMSGGFMVGDGSVDGGQSGRADSGDSHGAGGSGAPPQNNSDVLD